MTSQLAALDAAIEQAKAKADATNRMMIKDWLKRRLRNHTSHIAGYAAGYLEALQWARGIASGEQT